VEHSVKIGLCFGLTSGIITTLGLMVGLHSGTNSQMAIIGGILIIAVADAFSDALGIHISEESEHQHTQKEVWQSTIAAFLTKLLFPLTFIVPLLVFELTTAIIVSVIWGFSVLGILSFGIAREQKVKPQGMIVEHLLIASVVVGLTHFIGDWISLVFG